MSRLRSTYVGIQEYFARSCRFYSRRVPPKTPDPFAPSNEHFRTAIANYSDKFLPLLEAEEKEGTETVRRRIAEWPQEKLQKEGYMLTGLSAFWLEKNSYGQPVAAFWWGPGLMLPDDHRFMNGSQILLSRLDPLREPPFTGSILSSTPSQLRILFPEKYDLPPDQTWRIDLGRSDIAFRRMRDAIRSFSFDPQHQTQKNTILQGTHLRDIVLNSFQPQPYTLGNTSSILTQNQQIASFASRYSVPGDPEVVPGDPDLSMLNKSQTRAVALMMGERLGLVQGPPGTGKTKTIIETVKLLKSHFRIPHPILICTYTNVAVDNLVEGLAANNALNPLRIGSEGLVRSSLQSYTLKDKIDKHPLKPSLDALEKDGERLREESKTLGASLRRLLTDVATMAGKREERMRIRLDGMKKEMERIERRRKGVSSKWYAVKMGIVKQIVESADVICTTCISSANADLRVIDFPIVFLDEASMSTEPASLIPIMKGSQHLSLIGDHKQLPPIITSEEAQSNGLGLSLFERLINERATPSIMLDIQYRMHPSISRFPSSEFYNYALLDGTIGSQHLNPPNSTLFDTTTTTTTTTTAAAAVKPSVIFLDHSGFEEITDKSRVNKSEAAIVLSVVEDLLVNNPNLTGSEIGIISPYLSQITHLTKLLHTPKPKLLSRFHATLGPSRTMQLSKIEIKTVDGFEGREKEIIVFSTVRNNAGGYIGFLADGRRLNVGLTRARRGLIVVGSISTLRKGRVGFGGEKQQDQQQQQQQHNGGAESWRNYVKWLSDEGLVIRLQGKELERVLTGGWDVAAAGAGTCVGGGNEIVIKAGGTSAIKI